jgi:hypothetical protein
MRSGPNLASGKGANRPGSSAAASRTAGSYVVTARVDGVDAPAEFDLTNDPLPAVRFTLSAPATVTAGDTFSVTVTARDQTGAVAAGYTGAADLVSTDPRAAELGSHVFTAADRGMYTFTGVTQFTAGRHRRPGLPDARRVGFRRGVTATGPSGGASRGPLTAAHARPARRSPPVPV